MAREGHGIVYNDIQCHCRARLQYHFNNIMSTIIVIGLIFLARQVNNAA